MKNQLLITRNFIPVILGLIGLGIIILATSQFNAGVSPDSVLYMSTARNIMNGKGISSWNGSPMTTAGPLYPIALAVAGWISKSDPLISARYVNASLFGLIIFISGILFNKHLKYSPTLAFLGTVTVLFSYALIDVSMNVWTEPFFIWFVLVFLLFSEIYIEKGNKSSLVISALSISLASLTRNIGFPIFLVGIVFILFFRQTKRATKFWHLSLYVSVFFLTISTYLARNYYLSGFLFGYNPVPLDKFTFTEMMANYYHAMGFMHHTVLSWYLPERITNFIIGLFLILLFFIISFFEYKQNWKKFSNLLLTIYPILLLIAVYTVFILLFISGYEAYDPRYFTPIFVPVTLLLFILAEKIFKPFLGCLSKKHADSLLIAVLAVWLIYPTYKTIQLISTQIEKGYLYTSATWNNSETVRYLIQHPELESECTIYTNGADAIYLFMGLTTIQKNRTDQSGNEITNISQLDGLWPQKSKACLVWFDNITWRKYLLSPEELLSIVNLDETIRFQDGTIYYFSRK